MKDSEIYIFKLNLKNTNNLLEKVLKSYSMNVYNNNVREVLLC